MTKKELEELRNWEYVLYQSERIAKQAKRKITEAFDLLNIEYDENKDEICYVGDGGDDDYLGPKFAIKHHIDEMIDDGWVDVEDNDFDAENDK